MLNRIDTATGATSSFIGMAEFFGISMSKTAYGSPASDIKNT